MGLKRLTDRIYYLENAPGTGRYDRPELSYRIAAFRRYSLYLYTRRKGIIFGRF